jgi:hydrophobe/amphiphile efflux-1 (HAE1) family protein
MADLFIRRPILAIVLSILIVLFGLITLRGLAIEEYPNVTPPQIQVQAIYPGADAQTVEETVGVPLEQSINGVENMLYMQSKASNDGRLNMSIYFETGTDLDTASTLVQNRVAQAQARLPQDVIRQGVTVKKAMTNILMLVALHSPNGTYDQTFLANYASLNVRDQLLRVPGIGQVDLFGANDYSMRVWLDPGKLAGRSLTASDVIRSIREQNLLVPAGQIGAPPQAPGVEYQFSVRTPGFFSDPKQFEEIILKTGADGAQIKLRDVGRVELGSQSYNMVTRMDGGPTGVLAVYQTPGGDALASAQGIRAKLEELKRSFPADVDYTIPYDTTPPITASIEEILHTLLEAVALVVLVVFLFLQNWRATLIPLLTVPVALIGTFAFFPLFGFSVNVLTMFGLVLAIGIVVDDAIVVVEAVMHHMEKGMDRRAATRQAMKEVSGPVIAIALILCAVFVPVALMGGLTGQLYQQFAITIAIAVVLSAINALTLSPALCGLLLQKPEPGRGPLGGFFRLFNRGFDRTTNGYVTVASAIVRRSIIGVLLVGLAIAGAGGLTKILPTGFLPPEDKGVFLVNIGLPDAASLERTDRVARQVEAILEAEPTVAYYTTIGGYSAMTGAAASSTGAIFVSLKSWDERAAPDQRLGAVLRRVNGALAAIPEARVFAFGLPPIAGLGVASGFTFQLQDRGGGTPTELADNTQSFLMAASQRPELAGLFTGFSARVPQLSVNVDRDQVRQLGVPVDQVFTTLQTTLGGAYVNDFALFGRTFKVYVQADAPFRRDPSDIGRFFVRSDGGEMIPMSTLLRVGRSEGPEYTTRFNLYRAAEISGGPAPGFSSGQAMQVMEEVATATLPKTYGFEWSGQSFQEKRAEGQATFVFGLAILFVFLLLAALYESWSLPFAVLLGTPFALLGALFGTWLLGLTNNIYTQVGIVLLIGLAAKNAILIVEFAKMKYEEGLDASAAALEAARLRFRPILMTSFAFIFGCIPLMLASGSGAASRVALGTAVVFGMTIATLLGVFLVPFLYSALMRLVGRRGATTHTAPAAAAPAAQASAGGH